MKIILKHRCSHALFMGFWCAKEHGKKCELTSSLMKEDNLFKNTTGKQRCFLALLSSVLTLFVANAVLELNSSIRNQYVHMSLQSALRIETDSTGVPLDRRTKMDVVRDLRKTDPEVYPSSWTHTFLDHMSDEEKQNGRMLVPLAFKSNITSVICNESGQWSIFKTDRYGFNNEESTAWHSPDPDSRGVVLLGDSFVEGQCVQQGEDMASELRHKGIHAISLGTGGAGPIRELATLKEYALPLQPRIIFLHFILIR